MRKEDKQSDFVQIGSVIDGVLKSFRSEPDYALTKIWRLWTEVAGETIASNARPTALKGSLLLVHVSSAAWIHQLQFMKKDLTAKLNEALGKSLVAEIKFKIGPLK